MSGHHEASAPIGPDRRNFLGLLTLALGGLAAAAAGVPLVGYLLGSLLRPRSDEWIDLGLTSTFPPQQTRPITFTNPHAQPWDGKTAQSLAYVRRLDGNEFQVFAVNCTHLGCPVSWFPQSGLFLCPCHGGAYYEDGERASGPPPRGLYQYANRIENGRLQIKGGHLPTLQNPV